MKLTQSIVPLLCVSTCVSICMSMCACRGVLGNVCRPDRSEPELVRDVPLPQLEDVRLPHPLPKLEDVRLLLQICEQARNVGLVRCHLHNVVTYGAAW